MPQDTLTPAEGDTIHVYVPMGQGGEVKIHEVDPDTMGQDVTIQVSRERKSEVSKAIGVIVK